MERLKYILNIFIVALLFIAVAIGKDAKVLGESLLSINDDSSSPKIEIPTQEILPDGTLVINTKSLAKGVVGFAGETPVKVYLKDNEILKVELQANSETPSFIDRVIAKGLLNSWDNYNINSKMRVMPDAVSGATYSSDAIIANVNAAISYANTTSGVTETTSKEIDIKLIIGILVILSGMIITLLNSKNRVLITIQMVLNIAVLGFWCGSFISLAQITSWMANGFNLSVSLL